jgi:hypothetical protein
MSSVPCANEDDKIEVLEFYIGLLQDRVENFKKEKNTNKQQLNEFMSEYIDLEDKILNLMNKISQGSEVDAEQMESLTNTFNKYWGDFQDEWSDDYWDVYNMYRHINDKDLFNQINKKALTPNDSLLDEEGVMGIVGMEKSSLSNSPSREKDKDHISNNHNFSKTNISRMSKLNPKIDDSFNVTTVNLNKIDEEMKEVQEVSMEKNKEEKKRSCLDLDCIIF